MLLQTNSYIVPKDKRAEHARLLQRFRQTLARLGCDHFESYEQVGSNWAGNETTGRFVQLMRFRDRKQQQKVQTAERSDPQAQALIKEFCELINFPYQQQQGLFAVGFYQGVISLNSPLRQPPALAAPANGSPAEPSTAGESSLGSIDDSPKSDDADSLALDELNEPSAEQSSADHPAADPPGETMVDDESTTVEIPADDSHAEVGDAGHADDKH